MINNQQKFAAKYRVVSLAFEMGFIIALPLVIFLLLGKYLDAKFNTNPVFKIAAIILALLSATVWLTRRFEQILQDMRDSRGNSNHTKDQKI
jgi:F0F1-type ATP synthase assembly protein I